MMIAKGEHSSVRGKLLAEAKLQKDIMEKIPNLENNNREGDISINTLVLMVRTKAFIEIVGTQGEDLGEVKLANA